MYYLYRKPKYFNINYIFPLTIFVNPLICKPLVDNGFFFTGVTALEKNSDILSSPVSSSRLLFWQKCKVCLINIKKLNCAQGFFLSTPEIDGVRSDIFNLCFNSVSISVGVACYG